MTKIVPLARRSNIVVQESGNEILIYDLEVNRVFSLNETSALVWENSTGDKTISEIARDLTEKLKSPVSEEFVWLALERLQKENLLESEIPDFYEGISRREIIRKVGLASVVALPLVSSVIAPTAIYAVSCVYTNPPCNPIGTFCPTVATPTRNTDCCSCVCGAATSTPSGPRSRCT